MSSDTDRAAIAQHITKTIGPIHMVYSEKVSDELKIDICHVKSSLFRRYEVLVTRGMSAIPMEMPEGAGASRFAETLVILPKGWPLALDDLQNERNYWPVRLLKDLARYPVRNNTWLGYGHTVATAESETKLVPVPYAESTKLCAAILLPSVTLGMDVLEMKRKGAESIYFWTAIPLYASELQLKMDKGVDELLDLFDKFKVNDRIDPARVCVA